MSLHESDIEAAAESDTVSGPFGLPALSLLDWLAVACVAAIPIAYVPALLRGSTTPRLLLVLAATPVGLVLWTRLIRRKDWPAVSALVFVGAALLSSLFGPTPLLSVTGYLGSHSSVVVYTGALALWALGRSISSVGRRLVGLGLVGAIGLNVLVGIAQVALNVDRGPLATFPGRASGTLGNAAFYSSAVVAAAGYAAIRALQHNRRGWLACTCFLSFGTGMSGSRGAVVALLLVGIVGIAIARRQAIAMGLSVSAGLVAAFAFTEVAANSSSVTRLDRGGDGRLQLWQFGVDAWRERPVLGWGLGNHGYAVRPHFTEDFVRRFAWEDYIISWNDPHNIVVNLLVTSGVVGVVSMAAFVLLQLRSIDEWPFFAGFMASLLTWMLQPASVHSLPVAMFMLGASALRLAKTDDERNDQTVPIAAGLGVLLVAYLLVPLVGVRSALNEADSDRAITFASLLPPDPGIADGVASLTTLDALDDPRQIDRAVTWSTRPAEIQPGNPHWWAQHADRMLDLGEYAEVERAIDEGLAINGWSASAWSARLVYANELRSDEMAAPAREVVCRLELPLCVTGPRAPDFSHIGLERSSGVQDP